MIFTSALEFAAPPLVSLGVGHGVSVGLEHDPNWDTPVLFSCLQEANFLCCWFVF